MKCTLKILWPNFFNANEEKNKKKWLCCEDQDDNDDGDENGWSDISTPKLPEAHDRVFGTVMP